MENFVGCFWTALIIFAVVYFIKNYILRRGRIEMHYKKKAPKGKTTGERTPPKAPK